MISVIVPCYNQAQFLDECLQSVLDQTYQDWECIIVNDGSPDNTEEVAKRWLIKDSRFKYLYKDNGGLSSARNFGLSHAKGLYVQLLDCDDVLQKNKFLHQSHYFNDSIDIYISGYRFFKNEEGTKVTRILGVENYLHEVCLDSDDAIDIKEVFKYRNPFVISAPLYKKKVFEIVGVFNEELSSLEDWEFNFRCALHNLKFQHTGYENENKVLIRLHSKSMSNNLERMQENRQLINRILNQNQIYVESFGQNKEYEMTLKEKIALFIPPILLIVFQRIKNKC